MVKFFMTAQEALLKIKAMFAEAQPEVVAASFAEYVLASGAKVMIDKLELGGKVSLVDEAGNETPAPAGEHTLADGIVITLDENATIVEIETPEVPVEEPVNEVELLKKKVAEMEAQLADYGKKKEDEKAMMAEQSAKFSQAIQELTDVVIELTKTPSVEPTQPKEAFNKHIESKNDKISRFLNLYTKK